MRIQELYVFFRAAAFLIDCSFAFHAPTNRHHCTRSKDHSFLLSAIAVPVSELEKDLSPEERSITAVVRKCGPSVAFVTSIWALEEDNVDNTDNESQRRRWFQRQRPRRQQHSDAPKNETQPPRGRSLGSGSGFVIDSEGYVVTNYHVIELAYRVQSMSRMYEEFITNLTQPNITSGWWGSQLFPLLANVTSFSLSQLPFRQRPAPQVWVRINSSTQYQLCRIVDVKPELDVAVLKIVSPTKDSNDNNNTTSYSPVSFGVSSNLLVGQGVVAIGNPFGLDNTVTKGVVSALNRDLSVTPTPLPRGATLTTNVIRNCIQTDAAINPGNSGGPLLNTQGQVVGVNTAIVSTSGSNAGIGFAIPSDSIAPVVQGMIRDDRRRTYDQASSKRPSLGYLGVSILRQNSNDVPAEKITSIRARNDIIVRKPLNWVTHVEPKSPAYEAGIRPVEIVSSEARVIWGDAIVAVGGRQVTSYEELQSEFDRRVAGEQVALTLEDVEGERRVVYVTLKSSPSPAGSK